MKLRRTFSKNEKEYNFGTENLDGIRRNRKKTKIIYGPTTQRSMPTYCQNLLSWFYLSRLYCITTSFLPLPLFLEHIPILLDTALYLMALNSSYNHLGGFLKTEQPGSYFQSTDSVLSLQRPRHGPFQKVFHQISIQNQE